MDSPLTGSFVRALHPLPPSDRRMLLKEMGVEGVAYRDEAGFYEWLAERYRAGEIASVDAALRECCAKADERTSTPRVLAWLRQQTGRRPLPRESMEDFLPRLVAAARKESEAVAKVVDALAPNFAWFGEMRPRPVIEPALTVDTVAARLEAALRLMADAPDLDLLLRADALAAAIELHVSQAESNAERAQWIARAEAALTALGPDDLDAPVPDLAALSDVGRLREIAEAAERLSSARAVLSDAQAEAARAVTAARQARDAAGATLNEAEDARDEAHADLRDALDGLQPRSEEAATLEGPAALAAPAMPPAEPESSTTIEGAPLFEPAEAPATSEPIPPSEPEPPAAGERFFPDTVEADPVNAETPEPVPEMMAADELAAEEEPLAEPATTAAPVGPWSQWIATTLAGGRVGLAFHLATARDLAGGDDDGLPANVLEGVLHGRATRAAYDAAWHGFEALRAPLVEQAQGLGGSPADQARALMLATGALRPALVQSQAALDVLEAMEGDIAARLNPLIRLLGEMRGSGVSSLLDLAAPVGADERRRRAAAARDALESWRRSAPTRKTSYQPATANWQAIVAPDGPVGRVVALVLARKDAALGEARTLVERLSDQDEAKALILEVDEARSGRRHNPIEGAALKQLINLCGGVADLLGEWARAEGGGEGEGGDRHRTRRIALLRALGTAREVAIATAPSGAAVLIAADLFAAAARELAAELEGRAPAAAWSADDELALLPVFPLNARADVRIGPNDAPELAAAAADGLADGVSPPAAAFARALALENASAAGRLLDHLPMDARAAAAGDLERMIVTARERVAHRALALRQQLDDLQIAWDDPERLPDAIERDMSAFEEPLVVEQLPLPSAERGDIADFPAAHRRLDAIEGRLAAERAPVAGRLAAAVAEQEARVGSPLEECRALLEKGDLGTLAESVAQISKHGLSPSRPASSVELLRRFVETAAALGERPALDLVRLQRAAGEGGASGAHDFSRLAESDRPRAEKLLSGWIALRRATGPQFKGDVAAGIRAAVTSVMTALGFTGVRAAPPQRDGTLFRLTVATDPLRARERCLAPAFGSDANGQYSVVVVPDGEAPSALSRFDKLPDQVLLLLTGPLTPRQRRDFQRQSRGGTRSIALADAVTAVVLATEPDAGTRAFFDLALPFGAARPYADTSAQTSLEMFFGRERELDELVDRQGACLVYGGRQLGKTALLRQVELRENVDADRVAIYCDIVQVGNSRPPEDVWARIEEELKKRRVTLPDGRTLPERLRAWVEGGPGRYLLILLDEADHFLDAEMSADFPQIGRMKTLMDETRRGVKFVLAGLHNVQRFHRAPNSPFLHLGKSINVGPLLGGDREAARQMALEPMAALGIAFDQPVVDASHMLSLVGFYPSLMQSFGKAVMQAVDARLRQPGDGVAMPFALDRRLIEECFQQQAFRAGVVERFQKTLQLDERYELITYTVWQRAAQDRHEGKSTARGGYPASAIRAMADEWWPDGFRDTDSPDGFGALLDEMVEMGVLARDGERYALRSQRIAAMLGSEAEIDDRLQSFSARAPKRRADPMTSHRRVGGLWSPMSLRQEATLRERLERLADPVPLAVIGATPAAGGEDLFAAIVSLAASLHWPEPRGLSAQSADVVLDVVRSVRREARPQRPKLVVVRDVWPTAGEVAALRRHRTLRDPHHPVRVVYYGPPRGDVLKLEDAPDWLRLLLGPLPVEAMVHWLNREQLDFGSDNEAVQRALREATGGFLHLLDAIKRPPPAERQDAERLLERARATRLDPVELGLDTPLTAFARVLRDDIGVDPYPSRDLEEWAAGRDPADGPDRLALLRALGVVEPIAGGDDRRLHAFNPAAYRALA